MFYYRGLKEYETEKGYLVDTCLGGQDLYQKMLDSSVPKVGFLCPQAEFNCPKAEIFTTLHVKC